MISLRLGKLLAKQALSKLERPEFCPKNWAGQTQDKDCFHSVYKVQNFRKLKTHHPPRKKKAYKFQGFILYKGNGERGIDMRARKYLIWYIYN